MPLGIGNIFNGLFKHYGHTVILLLRFIDIAMLISAAWVSHYFWLREWNVDQDYRIVITLGILAAIIFFEIGQVYRPWRNDAMRGEIPRIVRAWVSTAVSVISIVAFIRLHFWFGSSYRWILTWWVLGLVFVLSARSLLSHLLQWLRACGWSQGRIVLVGLNQMAVAVSRQLNVSSWAGLQVIGYVDDRNEARYSLGDFTLPRLGSLQDLSTIIKKAKGKNVKVLFCGMLAPPTMGAKYQREFMAVFPDLANEYKVEFMPFILENVATDPKLNQPDGIHPNAEGSKIMTENVYNALKPLLRK